MMVLYFKAIISCEMTFLTAKIASWTFILLMWSTLVSYFRYAFAASKSIGAYPLLWLLPPDSHTKSSKRPMHAANIHASPNVKGFSFKTSL